MANKKYEEKYTKPDLREKIKDELMQSDKGGKKGQWSARKSQMLVQEYEKQGGGYKKDKKDKDAQSLVKWTEENWQTKEGNAKARDQGSMHRYLPEKVWERLNNYEKGAAERKKQKASEQGQQYVSWTPAIRREMKKLGYTGQTKDTTKKELYQKAKKLDIDGRSDMNKKQLAQAIDKAQSSKSKSFSSSSASLSKNKTKEALYQQAKKLDINGRSDMKKKELAKAVDKAKNKQSTGSTKSQPAAEKNLHKQAKKLGISGHEEMKGGKLRKAVEKEDKKQLQSKKKSKLVKMANKLGINNAENKKKKKLAKKIASKHVEKAA